MCFIKICYIPKFVYCCWLLVIVSACDGIKKNSTHQNVSNKSIELGESLFRQYCANCHQLPLPSLLDANTWEQGVLPAMGPHLGIFSYGFKRYPSYRSDKFLTPNYYPAKPVISNQQWQHIIDYYTALSPDTLSIPPRTKIKINNGSTFQVEEPGFTYQSPAISLTKFDTTVIPNQLYLFDLATQKTLTISAGGLLKDSLYSNAAFVDFDFTTSRVIGCNVGVINPNNGKYGEGMLLNKAKGRLTVNTRPILQQLARPVQIISSDLNGDKQTDYLVCEFGHLIGALSWMENKGDEQFVRHTILDKPGAIKAYVTDVNADGMPDIYALFSQGDEGIYLFINKGRGLFEPRRLLTFPPAYGSSYFELTDFNKDGFADIVYTCGDNADYSMILKAYHGVYLYLNDGQNNFKQQYFYPINGCYKAVARDYDNDGDVDLATIAFFADYEKKPGEGFVYLENKGNYNFEPSTFEACKKGRWLTMDVGDMNGDGKPEIVLGNFSIRPSVISPKIDWKQGPVFLVLKNISR